MAPGFLPESFPPMIALHISVTVCRIFSGSPARNDSTGSFPLRRQPLSSRPEPEFHRGRSTSDLPRLYHCSGVLRRINSICADYTLLFPACQPLAHNFHNPPKKRPPFRAFLCGCQKKTARAWGSAGGPQKKRRSARTSTGKIGAPLKCVPEKTMKIGGKRTNPHIDPGQQKDGMTSPKNGHAVRLFGICWNRPRHLGKHFYEILRPNGREKRGPCGHII